MQIGGDMKRNRINAYHSVENYKRRRALPMPSFALETKFIERILSVRKTQELVFISKTAAKNR